VAGGPPHTHGRDYRDGWRGSGRHRRGWRRRYAPVCAAMGRFRRAGSKLRRYATKCDAIRLGHRRPDGRVLCRRPFLIRPPRIDSKLRRYAAKCGVIDDQGLVHGRPARDLPNQAGPRRLDQLLAALDRLDQVMLRVPPQGRRGDLKLSRYVPDCPASPDQCLVDLPALRVRADGARPAQRCPPRLEPARYGTEWHEILDRSLVSTNVGFT